MTKFIETDSKLLKSKKEKINYLLQATKPKIDGSPTLEQRIIKGDLSNKFNQDSIYSNKLQLNDIPPLEDRMSQQEVAKLFGKSVQTIINWKRRKIIPYFLLGRSPIYSRIQLTQLASRNQHLMSDNSKL